LEGVCALLGALQGAQQGTAAGGDGPALMVATGYNSTHAEEGGRGSDPSCREA
jgi:hypothetical protein